jgi:hypothetical protein
LEGGWGEDFGVGAEAEDPAFDFFEAVEGHFELGTAIGEVDSLLAGVPLAAADEVSGPGVEFDEDVVLLVAFHDGEAALEIFVGVEGFGAGGAVVGKHGIGEAGEGEGADLLAVDVVGEEVPVVIDAGEVVGVDVAGLGVFGGCGNRI